MKNSVARSYLEVNKNNLNIYFNNEIINADALIIDYEDLKVVFSNFEKYKERFTLFKEKNIKIYVKLDPRNLKKSTKDIKFIDTNYITGFAIPHASRKLLNKMTIKARDFEHANKMNFGTISFIAYIDNPEAVVDYREIAAYDRIVAIYIDKASYLDYLGLHKVEKNYLREQVFVLSALSKKPLIDSYEEDNNILEKDLALGKELGACSKMTKDLAQLKTINNFYTPNKEEIEDARSIYSTIFTASKVDRKKLRFKDNQISEYKILRANIVLSRSNELRDELDIVVKNEAIKDASKILRPNKFYTFGEEIANGITHGIGVLFSLIFLVLLLIKANGEGFFPNLAYIIYALSAFTLYMSSTLYHCLPLGSNAKNIFHKFDRMSIYLLIAGTYTPLTLITIGGSLGLTLFIILWVGSLIGIILNFLRFGKFKLLHMILYVFLGWIAIFYIKTIFEALGNIPSLLILLGGIAYTIGIIFYSMKLFKFTHMVWHLFTILGTILHFIAIYLA